MARSSLLLLVLSACVGPPGPEGEPGKDGSVDWPRGSDALGGLTVLDVDTTWDGDVLVDATVYVPEGVTLSIAAGSSVDLMPDAGLIVDGILDLQGTDGNPVAFADFAKASIGNQGVAVWGAANESTIRFATFEGVDLRLTGDPTAVVSDVAFSDATVWIRDRSTPLQVLDTTFEANFLDGWTAISARGIPELRVERMDGFQIGYGIEFEGLQDGAVLSVVDATFTDTSQAIRVGTIGEFDATVTLQDVSLDRGTSYGFYFDNADVTLTDVHITDTLFQSIYGTATTTLDIVDSSIDGSGNMGIYHLGDGLAVTGTSVANTLGDGINGVDNVVLNNVTVDSAPNCIDVDGDALTATMVTLTGCWSDGIEATGDVDLTDVSIAQPGVYGIYAGGSATLDGVAVDGSGNTGLYALDGANIDQTTITSAGYRGIQVTGDLVATNLTVDGTDNYGVYVSGGGSLSFCSVANAGLDGIYFASGDPAVVQNCDVTDSAQYGIRGLSSGAVLLDVIGNNVTGSGSWGVLEAQVVDGNYIADNLGLVGTDLGVGGVVDGIRDTDSTQVQDADQLINPLAAPVPYTGPQ